MNELQTLVSVGSVPPSLSVSLETDGEQMVAVCRAERGKPAANISWSQIGRTTETLLDDHGFVTMESRLELLQGTDTENLTCVITHPYWEDQQILLPQLKKGDIIETNAWFIFFFFCIIVLTLMNYSCRKESMDHCCRCCLTHCFVGRSFILCTNKAICEVRSPFGSASSPHAHRFDWVMFCRYCQQPDSSQSKSAPVGVFLLYQFIRCVLLSEHIFVIFVFRQRKWRKWSPTPATFSVKTLSITHLQRCSHLEKCASHALVVNAAMKVKHVFEREKEGL